MLILVNLMLAVMSLDMIVTVVWRLVVSLRFAVASGRGHSVSIPGGLTQKGSAQHEHGDHPQSPPSHDLLLILNITAKSRSTNGQTRKSVPPLTIAFGLPMT